VSCVFIVLRLYCIFCDVQEWGIEREYVASLSPENIIQMVIQVTGVFFTTASKVSVIVMLLAAY